MVDDGEDQLEETQPDNNFNAMLEQMALPDIVGATMDDLFRNPQSSGSGNRHTVDRTPSPEKSTRRPAKTPTPSKTPSNAPSKDVRSPAAFGATIDYDEESDSTIDSDGKGRKKKKMTRERAKKASNVKGNSPRRPMPGKAVHPKRETALKEGGRGRPSHDNLIIGKSQIEKWNDCTETDETFFGEGYKVHKAFLVRTKSNLEVRISAAKEQRAMIHFIPWTG